jgi:hypothetical protein
MLELASQSSGQRGDLVGGNNVQAPSAGDTGDGNIHGFPFSAVGFSEMIPSGND